MRLVYLYQYFATPNMTGGTFPYEMCRWMVERGHEVTVVTSDTTASGGGWYESTEEGMRVHWCRVPYSNHMSYARRLAAFGHFASSAAARMSRLPADVILAGSPPLTVALPAVHAARKLGVPLVFEVCDQWPATAFAVGALRQRPLAAAARWLEKYAYRHAAHLVALSPDTKEGMIAVGERPDRITVIPNRVNIGNFSIDAERGRALRRRYPWLGDRPLIVYTGSLGLVNGVDYLARLAAEVRQRDAAVRFLVLGRGREEGKVRQVARQLGVLGETFFMLPPVPVSDIPDVLSAADLTTSTVIDRKPLWACSPSKLVDSLAAGRPMAINHGGWIAELFRQQGCGLVLDAHDISGSAETVVRALGDPQWNADARRAARRTAETFFDHRRLFGQLESVLLECQPAASQRRAA